MRRRFWPIAFIVFGTYGSVGEILIGSVFDLLGRPLWLYYNGYHTSIESFILFGLFGCMGFWLYKKVEARLVLTSPCSND